MTSRPLVILGAGQISRALLRQLVARADYLREHLNLTFPIAAVANSRLLWAGEPYLSSVAALTIADAGVAEGLTIAGERPEAQIGFVTDLAQSGDRPIVVDLTAADDTLPVLEAALNAGCDIVLANKKPLTDNQDAFSRLTQHPKGHIGYEATVGAGLPVIETMRSLVAAGDELIDITACLSGTLGYICTELEEGRPLSEIVPEARRRGFTEPDPRDDLSGADVRRKALILAWTMREFVDPVAVAAAPMIPLEAGELDEWLSGLSKHDVALSSRVKAAQEQGDVLRYIARILPGICEVGLREVTRASAVGRLRGTDNVVNVRTRFYDRPLVVSGPGAGPLVTAAGVFGDLLRLAGIA